MRVEVIPNHHIHSFGQLGHHRSGHFRDSICSYAGLGIFATKVGGIAHVSQVQVQIHFTVPDNTPSAEQDHP